MPYKPKRPCAYPGCGRLADSKQYCAEHAKRERAFYNKYNRSAEVNKTYGRAWKRIRDRYIKSHPLCEECEKQGRLTPVQEVHHRVPLSERGTHERSNLVSLCRSCHMKAHGALGTRKPHSFDD